MAAKRRARRRLNIHHLGVLVARQLGLGIRLGPAVLAGLRLVLFAPRLVLLGAPRLLVVLAVGVLVVVLDALGALVAGGLARALAVSSSGVSASKRWE